MIPRPTPEDMINAKAKAEEDWKYRKQCHAIDCRETSLGKNDILCRQHKNKLGVYTEAYSKLCQNLQYEEKPTASIDLGFGRAFILPRQHAVLDSEQAFNFLAIQNHLRVIDLEKELNNSKAEVRSAESNAHYLAGQVSRLRNL